MGSSGLAASRLQRREIARRNCVPPRVSQLMLRWFLRYARGYVRRHMHTVRVSNEEHIRSLAGKPVLLYMNHPSWWDPMIAAVLASEYLTGYTHYTPIDADALQKYRFFGKIGFFGVRPHDFESQRKLLEIGTAVLAQPRSALWLTPQARFSDVRERPLRLESALAHIVRHAATCVVIPVALEYVFWEERTPEALVRFGTPLAGHDLKQGARVPGFLELHLEETLDALNRASIFRDTAQFRTILAGRNGVGGVYDLWRRMRARVTSDSFDTAHGAKQ